MCSRTLWAALVFLSAGASFAVSLTGNAAQKEKDERSEAANRFKHVAIAFHHYHDSFKLLPPAALLNKKGQPLLSWRVLLLPFLEQDKLFGEFRLEEPWNSEHNKKLLPKMPKVYASVRGKAEPGMTALQVFAGAGTAFKGTRGARLPSDFPDGTSNTILIVEANELVPWTKPADLAYDPKKPLPKLGFAFPNVFLFATADGAQYFGKRDFDERTMRRAIDPNDGNPSNLGKLLIDP